jgi:soluble lytic murein transglycosylase-like protein
MPILVTEPEGIDQHLARACELWKVPLKLARAIARHESGMNPWAVNVAGESFMFRTKEEALKKINWAWRNGYSFDVGLMQVNSYWMRRFRLEPHFVLEPNNNAILAIWLLSQEILRFGISWKAVASYHTPLETNYERGVGYAASIIALLRKEK